MIKSLILVLFIIIIIFWYIIEYLDYIPTDDYQVEANLLEQFVNDNSEDDNLLDDIYQRVPSYNKDETSVDSIKDTSILRNARIRPIQKKVSILDDTPDILSNYKELDYSQMNKIIENILDSSDKKNKKQLDEVNKYKEWIDSDIKTDKKELDILAHYLNAIVNREVINSEFISPYHEYEFYKVNNVYLVKKMKTEDNKYTRYIINLFLKREYKTHYFAMNADLVTKNQLDLSNSLVIRKLKLIGLPVSKILEGQLTPYQPVLEQQLKRDILLLTEEQEKEYIEDRKVERELENKYKCFHPRGRFGELERYKSRQYCTSYHPEVDGVGVWDKPCEEDSECPYYKANLNYSNEFGGCKEGKCEMPLGVDRVGYKKIQKPNTPMCYNCQDKSQIGLNKHKCCHQQLNVINSETSNLKSADYMFYNDSKIRKDNKIILQTLGLKANPTL